MTEDRIENYATLAIVLSAGVLFLAGDASSASCCFLGLIWHEISEAKKGEK